ncbi:hypothetical protein [Tenacibaculum jejuense]|uniref:Probable lipoprotein n=1 Tax=Tenacibaculum jejuense TaxID=584609 RepID=A0A238U7J1_9FLAO|nr:hypothetical protein [Tenacibaculum jejuense]SNR15062.1 Probable lipoprotein precursor [Tenacibaculum jejuense]
MRGIFYVFISALLLSITGCNNNEDVNELPQESNLQETTLLERTAIEIGNQGLTDDVQQTIAEEQGLILEQDESFIERRENVLGTDQIGELQNVVTEVQVELPEEIKLASRTAVPVGPGGRFNKTADIIIGRNYKAGKLTITSDRVNLIVKYEANHCWSIWATNLYVGDKRGIPLTRNGYPNYYQFPYRDYHKRVKEFTYEIPLSDLRGVDCITVAAHSFLGIYSRRSRRCWIFSAWGDGERFENTRCPATYIPLCESTEPPVDTK